MITPPYLKNNDKIAIVSTARKISEKEIQPAVNKFKEWGLNVVTGNNLFKEYNQFAGTDEERISDLQNMLDDNSVKAVICARGGYGTSRIVDEIDFTGFCKNPKWIIGYSDVTVLHSHIHANFNTETLHATMPVNFNGNTSESLESLRDALFGKKISYKAGKFSLNRSGKAEGILTGGNLSILYSMSETRSDINTDGKILFIEDLDEYLYHIDRMIMNFKRSGKLSRLAGLIVGGMTEMKDNEIPFGKSAEEIIAEAVREYNYPVCFNFPAGHINDNRTLILGREIRLNVNDNYSELLF